MKTPAKNFWVVLPLCLFLLLIGFLTMGLQLDSNPLPTTFVQGSVPAFTVPTLEAPTKTVTEAIFKGRVSVLHVFTSGCGACRLEQPLMFTMSKEPFIHLVGLNIEDSREEALAWLRENGNPYRTVLFDRRGRLAMDLGVYGTPETFIIDKEGVIQYRHVGLISEAEWRNTVLPLLKQLN